MTPGRRHSSAATATRTLKLAERAHEKSQFKAAAELYSKAEALFLRAGDREQALASRFGKAHALRLTGHFRRSIAAYRGAARQARATGDSAMLADALAGQAMALRALGHLTDAHSLLTRAGQLYLTDADPSGYAYTLWALGGVHRLRGELSHAQHKFQRALRRYQVIGEPEGELYALCGLGGVSRVRGRYEDSLRFYTEANHRFGKELQDTFGLAYSHCGIANARRMVGDFATAHSHFSLARTLYSRIGDRASHAYTLWGQATAYKMQRRLDRAAVLFRQAGELFRATRDFRGRAYVALGLGELDLMAGRLKSARRRFEYARAWAQKHGYVLESLHARLHLALLRSRPQKAVTALRARYAALGSNFSPRLSPPLNVP
ncbi:MAG: tetratricopeptide repeat protein [Gemmatimonadetes bacterium]|nr:tetratricopeptide repeat protein [Gemmatimonadota bacterium]